MNICIIVYLFMSFVGHIEVLSNYYHTISEGSDILVPLSLFVQSDSCFVLQRDLDIL